MLSLNTKISRAGMMVWAIVSLQSMAACKKESKESKKTECPIATYNIECEERDVDGVFGGYLTSTHQYKVQSNCPEDATALAEKMSYTFGQTYKHCHVKP